MLRIHFRAVIGAVVTSLSLFAVVTLAANLEPSRGVTAAGDCTVDASLDSEELVFLTLINNYRAQNDLSALASSYTLSKAAQWKSQDMGANSYFAHDDLTRTWVQRIRDCGYGYNAWLGENIAAGMSTGQAAFDIWRNSPGHNANMLSTNFTAIGIGRAFRSGSPYGWYWSTEFGGYSDGWPAGTPVPGTATPTRTSTPVAAPPTATRTSTPQAASPTVTRTSTAVPASATPTRTRTPIAASPTARRTSTPVPPLPTATRTSTPVAASPTVTRTSIAVIATMHAGDLDGSISGKSRWNALVAVTVHDAAERPLAGAQVTGRWDGAATSTCTTDAAGRCTLESPRQHASVKSISLAVTSVSRAGWSYAASANHDPDGDSTGATMIVAR